MELMVLFNLEDKPYQLSSSLPYGDQRKLEIVRALALRPKILLLDEPVAGMSLQESLDVLQLIRRIRDEYHLTIIVVEHNMPIVMQLCDRIQVLNNVKSSPKELLRKFAKTHRSLRLTWEELKKMLKLEISRSIMGIFTRSRGLAWRSTKGSWFLS